MDQRRSSILVALSLVVLVAEPAFGSSPTQGAGARALVRGARLSVSVPPPLPTVAPLPGTNRYYFVCTARLMDTNVAESAYSNELCWTNTAKTNVVGLGWSASASAATNTILYRLYQGRVSGAYTNSQDAGTSLSASFVLMPLPSTNTILTFTTSGTNLAYSTNLAKGVWTPYRPPVTSLSVTNIFKTQWWLRGMGTTNKVAMAVRRY